MSRLADLSQARFPSAGVPYTLSVDAGVSADTGVVAVLTMKGKYGLKAMLHLARLPEGEMALSTEIAEAYSISKKFLDAILRDLRSRGPDPDTQGPGRRISAFPGRRADYRGRGAARAGRPDCADPVRLSQRLSGVS